MAAPWKAEQRYGVAAALTEGTSVRGTARQFKVDKNCVLVFAMRLGLGCLVLHNRLVRGLASLIIEGDETWSFIQKKQARIDPVKDPAEYGDAYTFIALDSVARLVVSFHVGKRTEEDADVFARDLRSRLTMVPHLSTDGFNAYPAIIAKHFGGSVDYGTAVKHYTRGAVRGPDHRYEPPRDPFVTKHAVIGAPQDDMICTAHVERYNLTQRHIVGRTRRLCLAFSKTLKGHIAGMALGVFAYNFVREHSALGKHRTPAMAAGLASRPWTIAELVEEAMAAAEEEPGDLPEAVPLAMPASRGGKPVGASRALPNGRGFLRAVTAAAPSAKGAPLPPSPPAPGSPPVPPLVAAVPDPAQLDLFSWRPRPPEPPRPLPPRGTQLDLFGIFGIDFDPEPPK